MTGRERLVREAADYMEEHLDEKLTLGMVAGHVYMSKSNLGRLMKLETGCTFTQYRNRMRIERGKQYLREDDLSISHIASALGYMDQNYFARVFRRYVGQSPTQYRADIQSA